MMERGLPCNVVPNPWYVAGGYADGSGGGILEWCTDESDARAMLCEMRRAGKCRNLSIGRERYAARKEG